jgi:hypothetical protein
MSNIRSGVKSVLENTDRSAQNRTWRARFLQSATAIGFAIQVAVPSIYGDEGISQLVRQAQLPSATAGDREASKLGGDSIFGGNERLPQIASSGRLTLPPITTATTGTSEIGNGSLPKSYTEAEERLEEALPEHTAQRDPGWYTSRLEFAAANTFSHPLYFEDVMLERHGHERFPALTPMISGARFLATVPMLPYLMTVRPACDFEYKMGHFRSGDCVYPYIQRPPYQRNAVIVEAAVISGLSIGLP